MSEEVVVVIRLDAPEAECWICGKTHYMKRFVWGYESMVLPDAGHPDYPERAGFPVCSSCSEKADAITVPTPIHMVNSGVRR